MIWHNVEELEELGPPKRGTMLWVAFACLLIPLQLSVEIYRVWRGLLGEPLVICQSWCEISVQWSESKAEFFLGMAFHIALISLLFFMIWGVSLWVQQWLYYRRH